MSDDVHKKMSPQRYFLNVYLATIGRKRIHDFAVEHVLFAIVSLVNQVL